MPIPKIGPIKGDISMAPITTAVEFAFNPIEATKTAKTRIQAVAPLNGISAIIAEIVASWSVSSRKSNNSNKNFFMLSKRPFASF